MGAEVFHHLKKWLHDQGMGGVVGDEGGFAPNLSSNEAALDALMKGIEAAGYTPGEDLVIRARPGDERDLRRGAATTSSTRAAAVADEMAGYWGDVCSRYPILSIEDGMDEEDWDGWKGLTQLLGDKVQLVGDDLFVTNTERLKRGIDSGVANSILIKVNQIGTLSETLQAIDMARDAGYTAVMSTAPGETEDTTIADLAVATGCGQIKTGAPSRIDRVAKYNQLLRIEEALGDAAEFPGRSCSARSGRRRCPGPDRQLRRPRDLSSGQPRDHRGRHARRGHHVQPDDAVPGGCGRDGAPRRHPEIPFGIHLTVICELPALDWGPLVSKAEGAVAPQRGRRVLPRASAGRADGAGAARRARAGVPGPDRDGARGEARADASGLALLPRRGPRGRVRTGLRACA
jgi:hypothetical protein